MASSVFGYDVDEFLQNMSMVGPMPPPVVGNVPEFRSSPPLVNQAPPSMQQGAPPISTPAIGAVESAMPAAGGFVNPNVETKYDHERYLQESFRNPTFNPARSYDDFERYVQEYDAMEDGEARTNLRHQLRVMQGDIEYYENGLDPKSGIPGTMGLRSRLSAIPKREFDERIEMVRNEINDDGTERFYDARVNQDGDIAVREGPDSRWVLLDPVGMDFGDLADLSTDVVKSTGGGAGAAIGTAAGAFAGPFAPLTMPVLAAVGGAIGEATTGVAVNTAIRGSDKAFDTALEDAVSGGMGEAIGTLAGLVNKTTRKFRGGDFTSPKAMENALAYDRLGFTAANRGSIAPSAFNRGMTGALEASVLTGQIPINRARDLLDKQFEDKIQDMTGMISRYDTGQEVKDALGPGRKSLLDEASQPFRDIGKEVDTMVSPLANIASLVDKAKKDMDQALGFAFSDPKLNLYIGQVDGMRKARAELGKNWSNMTPAERLELSKHTGASWDAMQKARSRIGELKRDPSLASQGYSEESLGSIYNALTKDMGEMLRKADANDLATTGFDPGRFAKWEEANAVYKNLQTKLSSIDATFPTNATPDQIGNAIITMSRTNPSKLTMLREIMERGDLESWDHVKKLVIHGMARASSGQVGKRGDVTSMESFLSNLEKLGRGTDREPAMKRIFGGGDETILQNVRDLAKVAETDRQAFQMINQSRTGNSLGLGMIAPTITIGGAAGATMAGSSVLMPWIVAASALGATNAYAAWLSRPGFGKKVAKIAKKAKDQTHFDKMMSNFYRRSAYSMARGAYMGQREENESMDYDSYIEE